MAIYAFHCDYHGGFEANGEMANPPRFRRCPRCSRWGERRFTAPQVCEDRSRFFRNSVDGSKWSYTLGAQMPDTRREYERRLAAIGAEPVSRREMPEAWKENLAYKKHVETGGERIPNFERAPHPAAKPSTTTVLGQLRKSGVKIG